MEAIASFYKNDYSSLNRDSRKKECGRRSLNKNMTTLRAETFAGRNFRVTKKTRNVRQTLSRMAFFGTNFAEKSFAKRKKSSFSGEKTFANGKIQ